MQKHVLIMQLELDVTRKNRRKPNSFCRLFQIVTVMWRIKFDGVVEGGYVSLGVCDATRLNGPDFVQDCCILAYQRHDSGEKVTKGKVGGAEAAAVAAVLGERKRRTSAVLEAFNYRITRSVVVIVVLDPKSSSIEYFKDDVCIKRSHLGAHEHKMHPFVTLYQSGTTAEIL